VALVMALWLVETLFRVTQSGLSIYDSRGAGQVTLLAISLVAVMLFSNFIAGTSLPDFFTLYARNWKLASAGFGTFYLSATLVIVLGYMWFGLQGAATVSEAGMAEFSSLIAFRTVVALVVVVVLAITEELIFRVFLMRYLMWNSSNYAAICAVVAASLIFAVLHDLSTPLSWFTAENFPLLIGLFVLGVLLCVTYISTGSITCAIGLHTAFLGSKVFLRKTHLLTLDPQILLLNSTADLRMSPIVWALWIVMGAVIFALRDRLRARFAIDAELHLTRTKIQNL
jgi:membrane protease YdiL (CAAX protease family)